MLYPLLALLAALVVLLGVYLNGRHLRGRQQAIRALLDGADALESQLHACKRRMQRLRGMLNVLPQEMSAGADLALSADGQVQAALKDLLAHRLWIQQHAATASGRELAAARTAMAQSSATLEQQLQRLNEITSELEAAQANAQTISPRPN